MTLLLINEALCTSASGTYGSSSVSKSESTCSLVTEFGVIELRVPDESAEAALTDPLFVGMVWDRL